MNHGTGLSATIEVLSATNVTNMIKGSIVAIVTPMHEDGSLDLPGLRKLIDWQCRRHRCIVIVGTTGESATVNVDEHCALIKLAVEHSAGRMPIIAAPAAIPPKSRSR